MSTILHNQRIQGKTFRSFSICSKIELQNLTVLDSNNYFNSERSCKCSLKNSKLGFLTKDSLRSLVISSKDWFGSPLLNLQSKSLLNLSILLLNTIQWILLWHYGSSHCRNRVESKQTKFNCLIEFHFAESNGLHSQIAIHNGLIAGLYFGILLFYLCMNNSVSCCTLNYNL